MTLRRRTHTKVSTRVMQRGRHLMMLRRSCRLQKISHGGLAGASGPRPRCGVINQISGCGKIRKILFSCDRMPPRSVGRTVVSAVHSGSSWDVKLWEHAGIRALC
ncbi:hypothetical protein L0F63_003052 [Massospora cicadina]|nr:hypothetical protein L0F63_003052 [Massospora cicadina]